MYWTVLQHVDIDGVGELGTTGAVCVQTPSSTANTWLDGSGGNSRWHACNVICTDADSRAVQRTSRVTTPWRILLGSCTENVPPTLVEQTPGCGSTRTNLLEIGCPNSDIASRCASHPANTASSAGISMPPTTVGGPHATARPNHWRTGHSRSPHAAAHIRGTNTTDQC